MKKKLLLGGLLGALVIGGIIYAADHIDAPAVNLVTGETATPGQITLRSAIQAATAQPGAHIITFSGAVASPINLSLGQITVGNAAAGNNISINGPGMGSLTVNQTTDNRVFSTGTGAVTFVLQDITLNSTGPGAVPYSGGGGAIIAGGLGASTTLTNVTISNFDQQIGNGGAMSQSSSLNVHTLTITNCVFTNNRCGGAGGAVDGAHGAAGSGVDVETRETVEAQCEVAVAAHVAPRLTRHAAPRVQHPPRQTQGTHCTTADRAGRASRAT